MPYRASVYTIEELKWDILILQWRGIGNDLHLFSFTKAGTSVPDEPCETPTF